MNATITGITMDLEWLNKKLSEGELTREINIEELIEQGKIFAGKQAGICYMGDTYFGSKVSDPDAAYRRWFSTIKNAHHSIGDHVQVTVYFEKVPKIFAMIMNSLQMYATSEKSARYTEMTAVDGKEKELYEKWKETLEPIIAEKYGDIMDEVQIKKLAQENARYFISLFTPATSFSYTTSIVQWAKLMYWDPNFLYMGEDYEDFKQKVCAVLRDVWKLPVFDLLDDCDIHDNKKRSISFFDYHIDTDLLGDSYQVRYLASGSSIAQLERHRTTILKVRPILSSFYIPDILYQHGSNLDEEWLSDMKSIASNYPQGMYFDVLESGNLDAYGLKIMERLCGRAQYETMRVVESIAAKFAVAAEASDNGTTYLDHVSGEFEGIIDNSYIALSTHGKQQIRNWFNKLEIVDDEDGDPVFELTSKTKCQLCDGCKEPCIFPAAKNFERVI